MKTSLQLLDSRSFSKCQHFIRVFAPTDHWSVVAWVPITFDLKLTYLGSQQAVRGPTLPGRATVRASSSQFRQQSWR